MLAKNTWTLKFKLIPLTNYSKKKKRKKEILKCKSDMNRT